MRKYILLVLAVFLCSSFAFGAQASKKKPKPRKKTTAELTAERVFEIAPYLQGTPDGAWSRNANVIADLFELPRITEETFDSFVENDFLVAVPPQFGGFYVDSRLNQRFRYIAPDALRYIRNGISEAYSAQFSTLKLRKKVLLKITSLVRTEERQRQPQFVRSNPNAAPADTPESRSLHTTGYTFDISCLGLTQAQILWIAGYLKNSIESAEVLAIYEYKASHNFHIFVIPPL